MNCRENPQLLETFHDGELHGREMREFALHVAQCADCEAQLAEWDRLHGLIHESLAPKADDLTAIWEGVESEIADVPEADNGWSGFRIAAASGNVRSLWRRRSVTEARQAEDADAIWLRPEQVPPSRAGTVLRGGMALAASLFLAVFLLGDEDPELSEIASTAPTATVAARSQNTAVQSVSLARTQAGKSGPSQAAINRGTGGFTRASAQHVQIHSVKQSHGEMAMWAEPAGNTAVIWVGEVEPQARR